MAPPLRRPDNPFHLNGLSSGNQLAGNQGEMKPLTRNAWTAMWQGNVAHETMFNNMEPTAKTRPKGKCGRQMRRQQELPEPASPAPPGAGLGFRRELLPALKTHVPDAIDFFELAPENWIDMGGLYGRDLRAFTERYPFVCHGLSLSLGGPTPLDEVLLVKTRQFMDAHGINLYTEHLSYCSDDGHLYDLLPIPFTEEAVKYVAARIRRAQDILERRVAIENASYYTPSPLAEMDEIAFIRAADEAGCDLHLVNNVYVNSVNHRYDPPNRALPSGRIVYAWPGTTTRPRT
jgi:hypothetical protein